MATKVVRHGGRPARLAVATDVTEKRRLEQQLLQSQKMEAIGLLAGGVAHDFNNLLGVIIGYCELISHDLAADSAAAKRLDQIAKAADRAAGLTRQLLAFGRKQVMQPKVLDLGEVVSNVVRMLRRLIGENIELETRSQADLGRVFADPGQLEQVIVNLTVNARDAMPTGGRLLLTTRNVALEAGEVAGAEAGLYVCLQVADNGCGMSAETLGQIFEPFFTTKEAGKGTGLGLSTVYGIVKQSGGHLAVASSLGSGTTFEVYLPRTEGRLEELRETRQQPSLRGSETVMVVEDADALRAIVREVLEQVGYRVLEAADPAAAVAVARSFVGRIHLVLSDVVLPGASGAEVVRQLQALQPGIRAVFMSGYTDEAIGRHGFLERGTHFLQKPFTSALLRQKLREALDAPEEDPADLPA